MYQPEAKDVMNVLWEETLAEFEFAGVREILEASKKRRDAVGGNQRGDIAGK